MNYQEKEKYVEYLSLAEELKGIAMEGTRLKLNGYGANAEHIATTCVFSEDCNYMRDYVGGMGRQIKELNFNKVTED